MNSTKTFRDEFKKMTMQDLTEKEQVEKEVIDTLHAVQNLIKNRSEYFNYNDKIRLEDTEWYLIKIKNHFKEAKDGTTKS